MTPSIKNHFIRKHHPSSVYSKSGSGCERSSLFTTDIHIRIRAIGIFQTSTGSPPSFSGEFMPADISSRYFKHPSITCISPPRISKRLLSLRLDDRVDREGIKNFPLARYAARFWSTHAQVENVSSCIKDGMECLFDAEKQHFSTWLWIYDGDRSSWVRFLFMSTAPPEKPEAVPLYYAARLGFRDLAEHLIAKYPEHVNARGVDKVTPIHAAASAGHANILSLLTE